MGQKTMVTMAGRKTTTGDRPKRKKLPTLKTVLDKPKGKARQPLTLKGDTSKPGGQIIKGLFEAAGHKVVDASSHADDAAPYLNALHGTGPIPRPSLWEHDQAVEDIKTLAGRIADMKGDIDILNGRLDAQASRMDAEVANRVKNREDVIALLDAQALRMDLFEAKSKDESERNTQRYEWTHKRIARAAKDSEDSVCGVRMALMEHDVLEHGRGEHRRLRRIWRRFVALFA